MMIFNIVTLSNGLLLVFCFSAMVLGFVGSYLIWQFALRKKSKKIISEAEAEAEVLRKEKILQAKERFLQLKSEHEKVINEKNNWIGQAEKQDQTERTIPFTENRRGAA